MKRQFLAYLTTIALVLSVSAIFPSSVLAAGTTCPSGSIPAAGSKVNGGLTVDGNCTLTNVTINGGVLIMAGAKLTLYGSTVNGGVAVQPRGEFDANNPPRTDGANTIHGGIDFDHGFDLDVKGGTVDGAVTLNGITIPAGFLVILSICDATLHGSLTIENMPGGFNGVGAGDPGEADFTTNCGPNVFDGTVFIVNSPLSRIELEGNTINGGVVVDSSQASLTGNTISGSLSCENGGHLVHYDADDTNTNTINGSNGC